MRAKAFLMQVRKIDRLVENKLAERAQLRAVATGTTGSYGCETGVRVQSSSDPHRRENAIVRCMEMDAEAEKEIARLMEVRRDVIAVIEQLDEVSYDLLYKMYIGVAVEDNGRQPLVLYRTLPDVAEMYDRSYSWAKNKHGRALKKVQRILDAREGVTERVQNCPKLSKVSPNVSKIVPHEPGEK